MAYLWQCKGGKKCDCSRTATCSFVVSLSIKLFSRIFKAAFFVFFVLFCFVVIVKESVFYAYVTKSSKRLWSQGLWIHRIHILLVNALSEFLPVCKCACHKCCFPLFWGGCLAIQWYSDTFGTTFQDVYAKSNNDNVVLRLPYCCHHRSFTQVDFDNFSGEAKKKKEKKRRLF